MAKILVIDDEPSILNLVTAYLKPEGYEVHTAMEDHRVSRRRAPSSPTSSF